MSGPATIDPIVVLSWGDVWELTTEHGTRILVDVRKRRGAWRWKRIPAPHIDGTINSASTDGHWQRLFTLRSPVQKTAVERQRDMELGFHLAIGMPVVLYTGMGDWWTTTAVSSARRLWADSR